jgi:hypothetical protein
MTSEVALGRLAVLALFASACGHQEIRLAPRLGNISIGDTQAAVTELLGEPTRRIATGDAIGPRFEYSGFEVAFWDGGPVAHIRSTDAKYCTSSGVCPGTPFAQAVVRLGRSISEVDADPKDGRYDYAIDAESCWLEVMIVSKMIESLTIACQP